MQLIVQIPKNEFDDFQRKVEILIDKVNRLEDELQNGEPISRDEIMQKYGISQSTYYYWVNDKHDPLPTHRKAGKRFHFANEVRDWVKGRKFKD